MLDPTAIAAVFTGLNGLILGVLGLMLRRNARRPGIISREEREMLLRLEAKVDNMTVQSNSTYQEMRELSARLYEHVASHPK